MPMTINWILERVEESGSTNEDLLKRWREGQLWEPVARKALKQTAGRGRMGRTWVSQDNQALTFSAAYPFNKSIAQLSGLSLACGLAVIKGISSATNITEHQLETMGLGLKWPNDMLLHQKKLAGLLIEGGQTNADQPTWIVIGIGVNLRSFDAIKNGLDQEIAGLDQLGGSVPIDADVLWLAILKELAEVIQKFERESFNSFKEEWNKWDLFKNQLCSIYQDKKMLHEGIERGVDELGYLLLESNGQIQKIVSGDVSLRKLT